MADIIQFDPNRGKGARQQYRRQSPPARMGISEKVAAVMDASEGVTLRSEIGDNYDLLVGVQEQVGMIRQAERTRQLNQMDGNWTYDEAIGYLKAVDAHEITTNPAYCLAIFRLAHTLELTHLQKLLVKLRERNNKDEIPSHHLTWIQNSLIL
ncbi:MAG: hypothetical protein QF824_00485 [Candidatus Woesearchaeota archaeon]|jgi:hypothetical protein|nr:hypothetical protein [Candidatus Woesearchaeota archaeon]MDP7179731.1 hypothetical protein [Candidatus Woesearchaeota archaeon]MDP7457362.1 hypothetical protein [Candidatus Woesearchaeota archaeon]|tara:strand:- start:138 stop:596 length:459 start_codon:yes stop_codon:yes gene_type:complete